MKAKRKFSNIPCLNYLKFIMTISFALIIVSCGGGSDENNPSVIYDDFDYDGLSSVCGSESAGTLEAADLSESPPHPIVLLSEDGKKHEWNDNLSFDWKPESVSTTELVACIGEELAQKIQTCEYSVTGYGSPTSFVYRYRYYLEVRLFSAYTGELIDEKTFQGTLPSLCPEYIYSTYSEYGSRVQLDEVEDWLSDYVNDIATSMAYSEENLVAVTE